MVRANEDWESSDLWFSFLDGYNSLFDFFYLENGLGTVVCVLTAMRDIKFFLRRIKKKQRENTGGDFPLFRNVFRNRLLHGGLLLALRPFG